MTREALAVDGGQPLRKTPFPGRRQFDEAVRDAVLDVFGQAWADDRDFGYQGPREEHYTKAFARYQGGGFADAVCSGTAALHVALAALELPENSLVLVPPVTDPGGITPVILQGHTPLVADAAPGSFNMGPDEFEAALTPGVKAAVVAHIGGVPCDMTAIMRIADERGVAVVEDCSQAHGAEVDGVKVGCFGRMAAFSTMYAKNHASGGSGGLVFCREKALYDRARMHADRGKPFHLPEFDQKNPATFQFAALNLNSNELACAIGAATLARLDAAMARRRALADRLLRLLSGSRVLRVAPGDPRMLAAPFFLTLEFNAQAATVSKNSFAQALMAEGVALNPDYRYVSSEWPWLWPHAGARPSTPNATRRRESSFNLLFHEGFAEGDMDDIAACVAKVERAYAR